MALYYLRKKRLLIFLGLPEIGASIMICTWISLEKGPVDSDSPRGNSPLSCIINTKTKYWAHYKVNNEPYKEQDKQRNQ